MTKKMETPVEFVLHDGEDDDKTVALHKFLDDCGDAVCDWEGQSDGIYLTLSVHVRVGDVIVWDGDQVTVRRRTDA